MTVSGEKNPDDERNNFPAGSVINNADIIEGYLKIDLIDAATFTNNKTIDLSYYDDFFESTSYQTFEVQAGSTFINSGSVTASFNVNNNSFITANDGSSFEGSMKLGSTANGGTTGTLTLNGAVTMNLSEKLNVANGCLIFTEGSTLDMKGGAITLSDTASIIYEVEGSVDENTPIEVNGFILNTKVNYDWEVTVKGSDGTSYVTTMAKLVPEPTTATLSLLVLCGLAMRRRR